MAAGMEAATNTAGLSSHRVNWFSVTRARLVVLPQVHSVVQLRHLVAVPIEHLGRVISEQTGQTDFLRLAPPRMVDGWIHVGVEAVLVRLRPLPAVHRLLL